MTGPRTPALPDELMALTRRLRLPYLCKSAPEVIVTAKAQRWDPAEVVRVLLSEEAKGRDIATREMRRRNASLPSGKTFATWREENSSIPLATQRALRTLEWVGRAETLSVSGPSSSTAITSGVT